MYNCIQYCLFNDGDMYHFQFRASIGSYWHPIIAEILSAEEIGQLLGGN